MDARDYLERIGAERERPSFQNLARLHVLHLRSVPFENLDIGRGVAIVLDEDRILDKIVRRRRGGFCYELNGAFAWLLRELGYEVTLLSAEVAHEDGSFGIPFDHMLLSVEVEGERGSLLADVGFGESFLEPLRPAPGEVQSEPDFRFRLDRVGDAWLLQRAPSGSSDFARQYRFTLEPRRFADYAPGCRYHQSSPESPFTQRSVVSRATPHGRVTLLADRLIVRADRRRTESPVEGEREWTSLLRQHFGLALSPVSA